MATPLHIVLLDYRDITHPEAGGAEVYLNELFQRIAARGHRVTLLSGRYRGARSEERIGDIRVLRIGNKVTQNVAAARAALHLARREPVDLFVENICKIPFLLPLLTRTPVLPIVLHLFGRAVFSEANVAFASYVWLYERLIPPVYRGRRFVAISDSTAADLVARGLRDSQIDIVSPGLDLARYCVDASVAKSEQPLFLYVGMLKRYKGIDIIIRAFAHARVAMPGARLVLAGKGTDRPRLEALVRSLGLADCVTFVGWISDTEKIDWLRRATALVYPSIKEGWGIPTMEAAACATPTLASDVPGLRDAVRHGETGFLIPHADIGAWTRCMIEVCTDAPGRARMAAATRRWASGFGWDAQAEKIWATIEQVTAARGR